MAGARRNGFALVIAIMAMLMVGFAIFILTACSNTLMDQSDAIYLRAFERNLTASGLAWAERNAQRAGVLGKTIELDVAGLYVGSPELTVAVGTGEDDTLQIEVSTSASHKRRTIRQNRKYTLELPHSDTSEPTF